MLACALACFVAALLAGASGIGGFAGMSVEFGWLFVLVEVVVRLSGGLGRGGPPGA